MTTVHVAAQQAAHPLPPVRRRLLLSAPGVRHLVALAAEQRLELRLPEPLLAGPDEPEDAVRAALHAAGALVNGRPHPSVLAGLAVVGLPGGPHLVARAATAFRRRLTVLGLSGGLGASLARDVAPDGPRPVEQSLFAQALLAEELSRCLPALPGTGPTAPRSRLVGVDPTALLGVLAHDLPGDAHRLLLDGADADDVLEALSGRFQASLEVTVSAEGADGTVVDRLLWVATDGGWWSLRPGGEVSGPLLDVEPVDALDLPGAVAPLLAGAVVTTVAPRGDR